MPGSAIVNGKRIQKSMLTNYQGAFSVLDHSTSASDREKRKLYFVDEIFRTKNSIKYVQLFFRDKEERIWENE